MASNLKAKITPRYLSDNLESALKIGLVPMIWGSPGIGKSATVQALADKYNLELIDIRVSMYEPVDFAGLPSIVEGANNATYLPFDLIPIESTPLPEGKDGWLLFFDEINHGKKSTVAAMYKVLLDKRIGNEKIHNNVLMIAAGNTVEDRAMVEIMSTATKSRLCNLYMEPSLKEWLEDVAYSGYDYRVISYLSQYPSDFYDFAPEDEQDSFCCPRSWSAVNRFIQSNNNNIQKEDLPILGGLLSPAVASKFLTYFRLVDDIVKYEDIVKDPYNARISSNQSILWATVTSLVDNVEEKTLPEVITYIKRIDKTFAMVFARMLVKRKPILGVKPEAIDLATSLGNHFL